MPWNQAGSNGNDRDPWEQNKGGKDNRPPDLDEVLRDIKNRVDALFGLRRGSGRGDGSSGGGGILSGPSTGLISLIAFIAVGFWLFTGMYIVDEGEQAVELRFGKFKEIKYSGLHWHFPVPFESVEIVNTEKVNTVEVGYRQQGRNIQTVDREALMLTQDENIIDVQFAVQYDIKSPIDLLFNVSEYNPRDIAESVVRQATESAVRQIVGRNSLDFAITDGRAELTAEVIVLVQRVLDRYQTGINIVTVEMQNAQPPEQVKDAFDDVVKAREDEERLKNLAEAYANDIVPKARGFAARIQQEAEAYKQSNIAKAEGEASRFSQVYAEYKKAPEVTRTRLYLESMESVLSRSSKLVIDQKQGNSLLYLPIDQLLRNRGSGQPDQAGNSRSGFNGLSTPSTDGRSGDNALRSNTRNVERSNRN